MGLEVDGKRVVMNHYGPRKSDGLKLGGQTGVFNTKFAEWVFDFNDLPSPDADNDMQYIIPAGSLILGATWKNITAGVTGTVTYSSGLNAADNSAPGTDDPDGIFTTSQTTDALRKKAAGTVVSGFHSTAGIGSPAAQIGTTLAVDSTLEVTAGDTTATAGRFQVIIEYQSPSADGVGSK